MTNQAAEIAARRELSRRRSVALAAGDIATFQALTTQMAALPMTGVPELTAQDVERWNRNKAPKA